MSWIKNRMDNFQHEDWVLLIPPDWITSIPTSRFTRAQMWYGWSEAISGHS